MATFAQYKAAVYGILNATTNTTTVGGLVSNTTQFADDNVFREINNAGAEVITCYASIPDHPRRIPFLTTTTLATGTALPAHVGVISNVRVSDNGTDFRPGWFESGGREAVQQETTNTLGLSTVYDGFAVEDNTVWHAKASNGFKFEYVVPSVVAVATVDVSTIPDEDVNAVIAIALANLFALEGGYLQAATYYRGLADAARLAILTSRAPAPVQPFQQAA